jgi:hypothetical protein
MKKQHVSILSMYAFLVSFHVSTAADAGTLPESQTQESAITRMDGEEEGFDQVRRALSSLTGFIYDGTIKDALEFFKPHKSGNGRTCATCHRPEDNFALTPATVEARYQALQARRKTDPTLARFLTPDPTVPDPTASQAWNPYAYVINNPRTADPAQRKRWTTDGYCRWLCAHTNAWLGCAAAAYSGVRPGWFQLPQRG